MPDSRSTGWGRRVGRGVAIVVALVALATMPATAGVGAGGQVAEGSQVGVGRQVGEPGPQLPGGSEIDPDEARRDAQEVLSGAEFQPPEPTGRSVGDRLRDWFDDWLPSAEPGDPQVDPIAWAIVAVLGLVIVGAATWLITTAVRRRGAPEDDEEVDASIEIEPLRSADEWSEVAARCAATGDHRGAVRAHFRVLTARLADRRLVADTPGRTVGELRHDVVEGAPSAAAGFEALGTLFEEVWYGDRRAGPAETERADELVQTTLRAAPRRGRIGSGDDTAGAVTVSVTPGSSTDGAGTRPGETPADGGAPDDGPTDGEDSP